MAFTGIIYRRFIVNDKGREVSYIGQTCEPEKRNNDFLNLRVLYSGKRIENARKKYGPKNFQYEVLETVSCEDERELADKLNELEIFYIEKFDSFTNGYNNTIGGGGATGYRHSDEYKEWQSHRSTELNSDPVFKQRQKEGMAAYFSKPEAHERVSASVRERYSKPEERQRTSEIQKKSHAADPDRAKRHLTPKTALMFEAAFKAYFAGSGPENHLLPAPANSSACRQNAARQHGTPALAGGPLCPPK